MAGRVVVARQGTVCRLTLDNADVRNALTRRMAQDLSAAVREADADPGVRVLVLAGANGTFCSGHDLRELRLHPEDAWKAEANEALTAPRAAAKPVVAAVEGAAYAGGFALALACDIRIAAEGTRFCANGSQLGLLPIAGQLSWLPHVAGLGLAYEMLMTGEPVEAETALRAGLVSRVVPAASLEETALEVARRIGENSLEVVTAIKRGLQLSAGLGARAAEAFEASEAYRHGSSEDAAERLARVTARRLGDAPADDPQPPAQIEPS